MSYALAIHTTTPELGLAISQIAADAAENRYEQRRQQTWALDRALSSQLHQYLVEFLVPQTWANIAFLAVAIGPGGYTGTRIGVVTARTLAQQLGCPLFGISTLAAVVWNHRSSPGFDNESDWAIQMPAQRGDLYTAIYSAKASNPASGLTALQPDGVMAAAQWQHLLETWPRPVRRLDVHGALGNSAASVLDLAMLEWRQGARPSWEGVLPYYGQLYVAEPKT